MKLIKPKFEIIEQSDYTLQGLYKMIEMAGRTCYKSENRITDDSAEKFVNMLIKNKHLAMLEHGTVYLKYTTVKSANHPLQKYYWNPYAHKYSKVRTEQGPTLETMVLYVTTNLRVLVENDWMDDLQYLCEPTKYHEKRPMVKFICDRGVSHEFVRHKLLCVA